MEKFLKNFVLLVIFLSFIFQTNASAETYKNGDILENEIEFTKKFKLPVSSGKWIVIDNYGTDLYGMFFKGVVVARLDNNKEILEIIQIEKARLAGRFVNVIDNLINTYTFNNEYDGCYERPEYYLLEFYRKGSTHNCFRIGHLDLNKELTNPDDPEMRGNASFINHWIRENSIKVPKIVFHSNHSFFSRLTGSNLYLVDYIANPKLFNSPIINFFTEESSEYHKHNIDNYPEHKKTIEKWISVSAKNHRLFEKLTKAKDRHKLDLDNYIFEIETNQSSTNLVEEIKKLNELYKSGAINKEEFKKAKEKLLN